MELKKNPKVDLNKDSGLFFVIGLTIVLFVVWRALEYKTYPKDDLIVEMLNVADDLKEEVPQTDQIKTLPPPPPLSAPELIEIVEDAAEIEESIIESTEASQDVIVDAPIMDVDDIEDGELEEEISVPFAIIENVPIFPGCEKFTSNEDRRRCFEKGISAHVKKEFTYPQIAAELSIKGRVFVLFEINTQGRISGVRTRGPDPSLEKEARRIVSSLPKMIPGMQRGKAVIVPYSVPINFILR